MNIKEFKDEFRQISCDTWGDAMEAWFEAAAQLYYRNIDIPATWEYKPSPVGGNDVREEDSYWYDMFNNCNDQSIIAIGNFLFRYCEYLRFKGINY